MNTDQETTKSKRKTVTKSKKPVGFSQEEVDAMVEQAKRDAAREATEKTRAEYEQEDPMYEDEPSLFGHEAAQPPEGEEQDFFDYLEENYVNKGVGVMYYIEKDGMFQKQMRHPLSWSKIQSMFGGGHYKVMAKKADNKQYIKSKVMDIAEPDGPRGTENQPQAPVVVQTPQAPAAPSFDPNFMLEVMAKLTETQRKDERDAEKQESRAQANVMTTVLTVVQEQGKHQMDMVMKMQDNMSRMMEKMQENTTRMIEKMDDKTTKMVESMKPKESGIDQFKMMEMIQKAEERGFERMKMIMDLAEDMKEERSEEATPTSAMGSLIKGVLPLLSTVNTQMQQQPMVMQQQLPPAQPVRRQAPPAVQQQSTTVGQGQQNTVRRPTQAAPIIRPSARPTQSPTQKTGSPTAQPNRPATPVRPQVVEKEQTIDELFAKASETQKKFVELALPLIARPMQLLLPTENSARDVFAQVKAWNNSELTPEALLKELPFDIARQIAVAFGMNSPAQIQWLKEFYAHFETTVHADTALNAKPNGVSSTPSEASDHRGGETRQPANS